MFKKRLNKNMHRSIVLGKGRRHWVFAYLFARKDRANIDDDELADFKKLAQAYDRMTDSELASALRQGDLLKCWPELETSDLIDRGPQSATPSGLTV